MKNACTAEACPTRLEVGQKNQALQIKPHVIYEHTGELSKEEVEALVRWHATLGCSSLTNELGKEAFKVPFEEALKWLVGEEEEAELAVESIPDIFAEPLFGLMEATHVAIELHSRTNWWRHCSRQSRCRGSVFTTRPRVKSPGTPGRPVPVGDPSRDRQPFALGSGRGAVRRHGES